MTPKPKLFYGWIIVFLAFLSITTYGAFYSYSAFLDFTESYFLAIIIAGIVSVAAIILASMIRRPQKPPRLEPVRD